jgi:sigma-B regulation protein RsbU (phosphoserine phosphatase)
MRLHLLLSRSPDQQASELFHELTKREFAIIDHELGSAPAVELGSFEVAVIDVGGKADAAVAQTKRWRAELGDILLPIVWVLPGTSVEMTARGLEAGADVVLTHPLEETVLLAQIRAGTRLRFIGARVAARANEARLLGEQLQKVYRQIDRELDAARRIQRANLPQIFPTLGSARFYVSHRPRNRIIGDFFDVRLLDENHIGFFLGDVVGSGGAGSLTGLFAAQCVTMKMLAVNDYRRIPPGEVLSHVNRELLGLGLEDGPLVAMLVGILHTTTGELSLARAGMPHPLYIPRAGVPQSWAIPGPFLGTSDASYPTITKVLQPGDRLAIGTDGIRPHGDPVPVEKDELLDVVSRYRNTLGQGFVDAVAGDLLAGVRHSDDFTLLCLEMSTNTSLTT